MIRSVWQMLFSIGDDIRYRWRYQRWRFREFWRRCQNLITIMVNEHKYGIPVKCDFEVTKCFLILSLSVWKHHFKHGCMRKRSWALSSIMLGTQDWLLLRDSFHYITRCKTKFSSLQTLTLIVYEVNVHCKGDKFIIYFHIPYPLSIYYFVVLKFATLRIPRI